MPWAGPASLTEPAARPSGPVRAATPALAPLLGPARSVPVSATLAANEALARRRRRGEPVLPLAFGESGLPVHPMLTAALADRAGQGAYGPVAGTERLRVAAAGYWTRRGLPTGPDAVVAGPGSKALLFGALLGLGADVAVPRPSWVSYAAQATLAGVTPHFVPALPGEGGSCDPAALAAKVLTCRASGRRIGAVLVTLPDNPTGRLTSPDVIRELCAVAERHDLITAISATGSPEDDASWRRLGERRLRIRTIDAEIISTVAARADEIVAQLRFLPALYRRVSFADLEAADRLIESLVAGVTRIAGINAPPA